MFRNNYLENKTTTQKHNIILLSIIVERFRLIIYRVNCIKYVN